MKLKLLSTLLLASLVFLFSCEKELSIENGGVVTTPAGPGSATGTAIYSYDGGAGTCTGAVVNGTYTAGTALTATNAVIITVDVDSVGTYSIRTNTVNGVYFQATGTFSSTGVQTITFGGVGTPTSAGSFDFIPGTTGCSFSITVAGVVVPPTTANCKACEYFPSCVGAKYTFADTVNNTPYELVSEIAASVDTTISGTVFQKLSYNTTPAALASTNAVYYNCSGGVTTLKAFNAVTIISGTTVVQTTTTPIKSNAAVGAAWTDVNDYPGVPGATYESRFSIAEKGISRTLGGVTYNDVIHIHLSTGSNLAGMYIESSTTEYYYAKGIGLIEAITTNVITSEIFLHQVIKSYFIP